jgi:hypothetical protein
MGIVGVHPAVFVRVARKGVTGYVTWKSVQLDPEIGKALASPSLVSAEECGRD